VVFYCSDKVVLVVRESLSGAVHSTPASLYKPFKPVIYTLWVCLPILVGCAAFDKREPASSDLPAVLARLASEQAVCGMSVAVIKNRHLASIATASGCRPALALNPDSVFQAASLSKPVFTYAVLKLVGQGKMALDTPVMTYLPQGYWHQQNPFDTKNPLKTDWVTDPRLQAITVRMVLNHTSGLPNWAAGSLYFDADPGTTWHYSGEGYVLLQRAVEAVTGERLDHFMAEQVFKPLGMDHSSYVLNARLAQNSVPAQAAQLRFTTPIAAATLYTSAADYGRFLVAVLNDAALLKQITGSPVTVDPGLRLSWGLGWGLERGGKGVYLWQWGNNPGYRAFVMVSVQTGDGFVLFTNSENGLALAEPITAMVLPDTHKLFGFALLREGVAYVLCDALGICL
jgi:CubicO group peptidase (beta-lactamase class C family)